MTIGIACAGADPVAAVVAAGLGAELAGRGAIGGFAVLAILDAAGELHHTSVQRGGVSELVIPPAWGSANIAALISSGPDRPEPLIQFLPGKSGHGLVTGHRLPNTIGADGVALNVAALRLIETGRAPQDAIDDVLRSAPEADAGLIAVKSSGTIGFANSARVARRPDLGAAYRFAHGRGYALLHNSIYGNVASCAHLAAILGDLAWASLTNTPGDHALLRFERPVPLRASDCDRVVVDDEDRIVAIESANPALFGATCASRTVAAAPTMIVRNGQRVGAAMNDLYARIADGSAHPLERRVDRTLLTRRQ
ncbi:DUF6963 family protein [Bradyrhizobium sp. STM 3557]|uniref:DUF6963 family protein n=1 Tax=Bradyrhizobium sp. STM 3557 TaxID=578920 RepID=UPI00388DC22A